MSWVHLHGSFYSGGFKGLGWDGIGADDPDIGTGNSGSLASLLRLREMHGHLRGVRNGRDVFKTTIDWALYL